MTSDRRAASRARLRQGVRCYRVFLPDADVETMLDALRFDSLQTFLSELVEDYRRQCDMSSGSPVNSSDQ
jgi:hypothetical protein